MLGRKRVNTHKRRARGSFVRQFFIGLLLALVLFLVGGAIWFGSRMESLTIVEIKVEGGETVEHDEIKRIVEAELEGSYYRVVPKRFSWTYPEENVKAVVADMERVKDVSLVRPDGRTLTVRFSEYSPAALWCNSGEFRDCIFLDNTGYAYTSAPDLTGTALLRYKNGEEPEVGKRPFEAAFMRDTDFFATVAGELFDSRITDIEKVGINEVTFELSGGGLLKVNLQEPVNDSISNLEVLLVSETFQHLRPGNFQYIDLRFGDKVFVNEEAGQPDNELSATSTDVEMAP